MKLFERLQAARAAAEAAAEKAGPRPVADAAPTFTLAERLGVTSRALPEGLVINEAPTTRFGKEAVTYSSDLARIKALPRRKLDPQDPAAAEKWTRLLRNGNNDPCDCVAKYGTCIKTLLPIQGWALEDASQVGGELGLIGCGAGKTGLDILLAMVIPGVKQAVLFIPPALRFQFSRDFEQWSRHFKVPNLGGGRWFTPGLPVLHVVAYSELSNAKATDLLTRLQPDLIIGDEAHNLKRRDASRTKRFLRFFSEHPTTKLVALSGTLTTRSLKDYGHLAQLSLRDRSPLPLHYPTLEEWAEALDVEKPGTIAAPIGALRQLCNSGEHAREGFRRRLVETQGVVATIEGTLGTSLVISERKPTVPMIIKEKLKGVEATWQRPDGEELTDTLSKASVMRQLAAGFYYRWRWPRGEPLEVIERWLDIRKKWHREVRDELKNNPREFRDSPLLVTNAAIKWWDGFSHTEEDGTLVHYPPFTRHRLTWASEHWPKWKELRDTAQPETEAVWVDDFLVQDAVAWAQENVGILWYEHDAFGRAVAKAASLHHYGPGKEANEAIVKETGKTSIVASIKAHSTGKNLQAWSRMLVMNLPSAGDTWEQMLARVHRQGQLADEVEAVVYRHTPEMMDALDKAISHARYVQATTGQFQKLVYCAKTFA